jgi:hypothetical protein
LYVRTLMGSDRCWLHQELDNLTRELLDDM